MDLTARTVQIQPAPANAGTKQLGPEFTAAFEELLRLGRDRRPALMCSEAVWWRCHRRIITDYLLLNGHAVDHLMGPDHTEHARPTPGARRSDDGKIVYPAVPDSSDKTVKP